MTQHVTPDYQQLFHMRAKMARLRIQTAALEREQKRTETVNQIRVVLKQAPVVEPVTAKPVLRYMLPIGPIFETGKPMEHPMTIGRIQREVSEQFDIPMNELLSHRRQANLVFARQFAMWRCKRETLRTYPEIGRMFEGRDHTTVLHAVRKMDALHASGELAARGLVP